MKATFKMIFKNEDGETLLQCPHCGDVFLHQYKTEIFDRDEDDLKGLHVTTDRNDGLKVNLDLKNNPSQRRDGLRIHFFCEVCNASSALEIYQHKGQTFVKFYKKK